MTLQYPVRHVFITRSWGVNGHIYSRFGFKGHNGVDYRLFDEAGNRSSEAVLYAPHDGRVLEARNDPDGYGLYLKIESAREGSILAHLKSFSVKVGDEVKQGQVIGVCDNTGWSTGAHLHWGYYTMPRNRANGYGGTINQEKLGIRKIGETQKEEPMSELLKYLGVANESEARNRLKEHLGEHDGKCDWGNANRDGGYLGSERRKSKRLEDQRDALNAENKQLNQEINDILSRPPVIKEVIKEIKVEVPVEVVKEVPVEVIREIRVPATWLRARDHISLALRKILEGKW